MLEVWTGIAVFDHVRHNLWAWETQPPIADLLRQSVLRSERLSQDPTFRLANRWLLLGAVQDMDSTDIPVYGQQENSAYNGHFEFASYHPLLLFDRKGRLSAGEAAAPQRPQLLRTARNSWCRRSSTNRTRQRGGLSCPRCLRKPEIYVALDAKRAVCEMRPANDRPKRDNAELLTHPVGWPSQKPVVWYKGFLYPAVS